MLEAAEKLYNKMETYHIENNKEWDYSKRSINHQVEEADTIRKIMRALEKRSTLVSKKRSLDKWDNDFSFLDFVDVLPEKNKCCNNWVN